MRLGAPILAILLALSGTLVLPTALAAPADAVQSNPLTISWTYPAHSPGDTFTIYADVVNVAGLFSFQMGFRFDKNYLEVLSVTEGGFLSHNHDISHPMLIFPGLIDNANGIVNAYGWSLTDTTLAKSGTGHLIEVQMRIKPSLWPPFTGTTPGSPVLMMDLTDVNFDPAEIILMYSDGVTEITPLPANLHDGYFTLSVSEAAPVAAFIWIPVPYYAAEVVHFDASGSTPGWNGYASVPIIDYAWDWGDASPIEHVAAPLTTHTFSNASSYIVTLVVTDADGRASGPFSMLVTIIPVPTGANLDLISQNWRYVDPITITPVPVGVGPGTEADLFRPGDMVQLFASATYGGGATSLSFGSDSAIKNENYIALTDYGEPVQHQLIAFEVHDNHNNTVLAGTALTNASGWAEYDFRIPWPSDGPEPSFGMWKAIATWQIGSNNPFEPPFEETLNDTMPFEVGWGLWIVNITTDKPEYYKTENVLIRIHVENDYMVPVTATVTSVIYDDLLVAINTPAILTGYSFNPGITPIDFVAIHLEPWAFVGIGTAKANAFTKLPFLGGTAFCPEVTTTFVIKKTP